MIKFDILSWIRRFAPSGAPEDDGKAERQRPFREAWRRLRTRFGGDPRKSGRLWLELRCRDKLIFTADTRTMKDVTTIGKAPDNDWQIPKTDGTCAARHARLVLSPAGVELVAEEGNFLYCRGERVTRRLLRKNDRVAFGDSELFVKLPPATRNVCDVHRLEFLGGERDGAMIRLEKTPFRIGSAPDNDLMLDADVVSRHHAEIRVTDAGETWIKDLLSSNGTFVNGERMGKQERMLMDSDELSLAQFDFRFLDRNVLHTRTQFGKKLLIMGLTILLVLLGFGIFYISSPSTETVINAVDFYLFRDRFDVAERLLAKMPESRGFQRYTKQYQEYRTRIPYCRRTYRAMLEFQDFLKNSRWRNAIECFGKLDLKNQLVWDPANPATEGRIQAITQAKEMLDILLSLRNFNASPYNSQTLLKNLWKKLMPHKAELEKAAARAPEYLRPLHRELQILLTELDRNVGTLNWVEEQTEALAAAADLKSLDAFILSLKGKQKIVTGAMRVYIRDLTSTLDAIRGNLENLRENDLALFDLRVTDIRQVPLISADDCMRFPHLFQMRKQMEQRCRKQFKARDDWRGLQRLLGFYLLVPGKIPEEIRFFSDERRIEGILDLPEIAKTPSGHLSGEYERVFGSRYFYEVIQQTVHSTSNVYASDLVPGMKTIPKCVLLKDLYRGLQEALLWMNLPQNQWLLQGKMMETRDYYLQLRSTLPPILRMFENIAARNRNNRKYYLAKTAYFFFAPAAPDIPEKMRVFALEWRQFRSKQQNLLSQYNPMDPALARRVRDTIIARGIPGDPVFNWMRNLK